MHRGLRRTVRRRRGVGTLELILALPAIVIILVAIFEFTSLMVLQYSATHAATVAPREAGKEATIDELAEIVQAMVAPNCITAGEEEDSGTQELGNKSGE